MWRHNMLQNNIIKIIFICLMFLILLQSIGTLSYFYNYNKLSTFNPWGSGSSFDKVPFFARWDSGWYISIVKENYVYNESRNSNVVFFPLYPILIGLFSKIFPFANYFYIGLVISWLAFVGLMICLYKLLSLDLSIEKSFKTIIYILTFPFAFFFVAVYTEAIFLFLVLLSFYLARRQSWFWASLFGFLAAICRLSGIFIFPALLCEYWLQNKNNWKFTAKKDLRILWLLLIPAGLLMFGFYLQIKTGYFLAFIYNQTTYERQFTMPWQTILSEMRHIWTSFNFGLVIEGSTRFLNFSLLVFATLILIVKRKEIRLSYLVFACLSIALPLFSNTTLSVGRYLLVIFPIFIAMSFIDNKIFKNFWSPISFLIMMILTWLFVGWYFVV